MQISFSDGYNGPGRAGGQGTKPLGPYLQAERVKMRGAAILDAWDHPIAYFPARKAKNNIRLRNPPQTNPGAGIKDPVTGAYPGLYCDLSSLSQYNAWDNLVLFVHPSAPWNEKATTQGDQKKALTRIRAMLGDVNDNGYIDSGESPATDEAFLLWSAGPDGNFGPSFDPGKTRTADQEVRGCDDVMNFR
jgi:hypothetical protein